jgi:hypothetical protein
MHAAPGLVAVAVEVNDDPEALGCRPAARGFPYCSATVSHPARGYAAALGWIQLVRSTDGLSGGDEFDMDPYEPLGPVAPRSRSSASFPRCSTHPPVTRSSTWTGSRIHFSAASPQQVPVGRSARWPASLGVSRSEPATSRDLGPRLSVAEPGTRTGRCSRANTPSGASHAQRTLRLFRLDSRQCSVFAHRDTPGSTLGAVAGRRKREPRASYRPAASRFRPIC